jgi:hypothetical protein
VVRVSAEGGRIVVVAVVVVVGGGVVVGGDGVGGGFDAILCDWRRFVKRAGARHVLDSHSGWRDHWDNQVKSKSKYPQFQFQQLQLQTFQGHTVGDDVLFISPVSHITRFSQLPFLISPVSDITRFSQQLFLGVEHVFFFFGLQFAVCCWGVIGSGSWLWGRICFLALAAPEATFQRCLAIS